MCPLCRTNVDSESATNEDQFIHFTVQNDRQIRISFELGRMGLNTRWNSSTRIYEILDYVSHFDTLAHPSEAEISFSTPGRTYTFKTTESYNSLRRTLGEILPFIQRLIHVTLGHLLTSS